MTVHSLNHVKEAISHTSHLFYLQYHHHHRIIWDLNYALLKWRENYWP